jgi:hypothetical protein
MDTIEPSRRLDAALRDFLWDQWVALSLAGRASGAPVPFVVDPEALLLATLRFAFDEGRFRGEVLDWLSRNGGLLSVQRVKNLDAASRLAPPERLRALADFMRAAGFPNWKTLAARIPAGGAEGFPESSGRGLGQAPNPARPEAFLLRMRQLFGVNARAEVVTWLLTHEGGHSAGIARETGWFSKSVQAILNDLEQAGLLVSRIDGKRKEYALRPNARLWHPELGAGLRWFPQGMCYGGAHYVLQTLAAAADPGLSAAARAIAIRRDLLPLETAFRLAGLDSLFGGAHREKGEALLARFDQGVNRLIGRLETREGLGR